MSNKLEKKTRRRSKKKKFIFKKKKKDIASTKVNKNRLRCY